MRWPMLTISRCIFLFSGDQWSSSEEVDQIFLDSKNIFQTVKIARNMPRREESNGTVGEKGAGLDHVEGDDKS